MNVSQADATEFISLLHKLGFDEELYFAKNKDLHKLRGDIRRTVHHLFAHGFGEGRLVPLRKIELLSDALSQSKLSEEAKTVACAGLARSQIPQASDASRLAHRVDHESPLAALSRYHTGAYWLTPADLGATMMLPRRVLVVGSCFANSWGFEKRNPSECPCDFILTNNFAQLGDPPRDPAEYDFQVVQIAFRSIFQDDLLWQLRHDDLDAHSRAFRQVCDRLAVQLASSLEWNTKYGLLTFVTNFFVPQDNPLGRLMPRYDLRNPSYFVERVNEALEGELRKYKNAFLLDTDKIAASMGRRFVQDDSVVQFSHNALTGYYSAAEGRIEPLAAAADHFDIHWSPTFLDALWAEMMAMFRTLRQVDPVKLVVLDLDDTLWKGVSGEIQDIDPIMLEGWPLGVAEALCYLKKRGILLAIISKNDSKRIAEIWSKMFRGRLKLEDFAVRKINWQPKTENMQALLSEVNLLPRNTVFIDDNPVERAAMKAAFPDMRVLGKYPYYLRRILLWAPETQVPAISEESARRTEMIQAQVERDAQRQSLSREEFLASLSLQVTLLEISSIEHPKFPRAFELLNKTNQFNTTGRRWRHEDCVAAFAAGTAFLAFEVEDRFSSYGLVGVIIIAGRTIEQFVMSCRVVGLEVENAALSRILPGMRRGPPGKIVARMTETDANLLCRGLYKQFGFSPCGRDWALEDTKDIRALPMHIRLVEAVSRAAELV